MKSTESFLFETSLLCLLDHPRVVQMLGVSFEKGEKFLAVSRLYTRFVGRVSGCKEFVMVLTFILLQRIIAKPYLQPFFYARKKLYHSNGGGYLPWVGISSHAWDGSSFNQTSKFIVGRCLAGMFFFLFVVMDIIFHPPFLYL